MKPSLIFTLALLALAASPRTGSASERLFAYTYQTLTAPVGEIELENSVTWKSRPGIIRTFEFRHELEFGLTDKTQLGLYLANWQYDARSRGSKYTSSTIELIHNLSNPVTDILGSAIYGEIGMGDRSANLEGKLLLEKRIGRWTFAWNGALEAVWDGKEFGDLLMASGELSQSAGLSYEITKSFSLGAEVLHELPLGKWHGPANAEVYVGPNVTIHKGRFFATLSTLFQTTDKRTEQSVQGRAIVGIRF